MGCRFDESTTIEIGRLFFLHIYSQDVDLLVNREFRPGIDLRDWKEEDYINAALAMFSIEERVALANWLEPKLTSEENVLQVLGATLYSEVNPKHWTNPNDASQKGAMAMGIYFVHALRAGRVGE